jgi:hypothetical protein
MQAVDGDFRARLSKLVGRLGSAHVGERDAAVQAIDKALGSGGHSWAWLCDLVDGGELRNGEREKLFARLYLDRLRGGLACAWAMNENEARDIREIVSRCEEGLAQVSAVELARAVNISDDARRKAGMRQ